MFEDIKITLIIGAGASADFHLLDNENKKRCYKPAFGVIEEKNRQYINMPTGEELVRKMRGFKNEILKYFLYEYLKAKALERNNLSNSANEALRLILDKILLYLTLDIRSGNVIWIDSWLNNINTKVDEIKQNGITAQEVRALIKPILVNAHIITETNNSQINNNITNLTNLIIQQFPELKIYYNLSCLLEAYDPPSIDNFLSQIEKDKIYIEYVIKDFQNSPEEREKLVKAGKDLIAFYLLRAEDSDIFNANNRIWYRWLRNAIMNCGSNAEEIKNNLQKLTIICFNYDRSLEHFLKEKLKKEIYESAKARILYPYGSLSESSSENAYYGFLNKLNIFSEEGLNEISHFFLNEKSTLKDFAEKIRVIDDRENKCTNAVFENGVKSLKKTTRVYFLGFGFLHENCDRLNLRVIPENCKIYYTNFDTSGKIKSSFENYFSRNIRLQEIPTSSRGVYEALEKDFDLDLTIT